MDSEMKTPKHIMSYYSRLLSLNLKPEDCRDQSSNCRICLQEGNSSIFGKDDTKQMIEILQTICNVNVTKDDDLAKLLCSTCSNFLKEVIAFRKVAMRSAHILRKPIKEELCDSIDVTLDEYVDSNMYPSIKAQGCSDSVKEELCDSIEITVDEYIDTNTYPAIINVQDDNGSVKKEFCESIVKAAKKLPIKNQDSDSDDHFEEWTNNKCFGIPRNIKVTCHICNKVTKSQNLGEHIAMHDPNYKRFMCDVCAKLFRHRASFDFHYAAHTTDFFMCEYCPYKVQQKNSLRAHLRIHSSSFKYTCTECPAQFQFKGNLNAHFKKHKVPEFNCDACKKAFYSRSTLKEHYDRDHLGISSKDCSICGKTFCDKKSLMKHERKIHKREKLRSGRMPNYLKVE